MNRDERKRLAAALRSARHAGWEVRWRGLEYGPFSDDQSHPRVEWDNTAQLLRLRGPKGSACLPADSVTRALDLLTAYGYLTADFSSAYAEGHSDHREELLYDLLNDEHLWSAIGREMDAHGVRVLPDDDSWETAADISAVGMAVAEAIGERS